MKNESKEIGLIWEEIIKTNKNSPDGYDPWDDNNLNEIKIKYFFDRLCETKLFYELYQEPGVTTPLYIDQPTTKGIHGLESKYENNIDGNKFYTIVTLYKALNYSNKLEYDIIDLLRFKQDITLLKDLKNLLDQEPNKFIMSFRFEDENQLMNITGQIKNKASRVLAAIYYNIREVRRKHIQNIIAYYMLVSKTESKRINLYKHIMDRTIPTQNQFVDKFTFKGYDILYFW